MKFFSALTMIMATLFVCPSHAQNLRGVGMEETSVTTSHGRRLDSYSEIESQIESYEEIAFEHSSRSTGPDSNTIPGRATNFRLVRAATPGSAIVEMVFHYVDSFDPHLLGVGVTFSDGTVDFVGELRVNDPNVNIDIVKLNGGKLTDTITVTPRLNGNSALVANVRFDSTNQQFPPGSPSNPGVKRIYDVDGRFLTGLIHSPGMRNLQFVVSKEVVASELTNIVYADLTAQIGEAKNIDTVTLRNESSETQEFAVSYTSIKESAVSFATEATVGFSATFGISTTVSAKIPFVGSAETTASLELSAEAAFTVAKANEKGVAEEVTKEVTVSVPPMSIVRLEVTQFQEEVRDIDYTATHRLTFEDGSAFDMGEIDGTFEGVIVSNVFIKTVELPLEA